MPRVLGDHFNKVGLKLCIVIDGSFGINKDPHDVEKTLLKMKASGAHLIKSTEILDHEKPLE